MKRLGSTVFVVALLLVVTTVATAAQPKKGATFVGDIKSSPFTMHIDMTVNATGKKLAHFTYLCGTGRPPTTVMGIPIDSTGHFKWSKMTGTIVVWKMAGRFTSQTKAFVSLNSVACGGSKGATTLSLKP
jgi:hypothetical protein